MKLFEIYNIYHVKEQLHNKVIGKFEDNKHIKINELITATKFFIRLLEDAKDETNSIGYDDVKRCFAVSFHDIVDEMEGNFGEGEL